MKAASGKDASEVVASLDDDASRKLAMCPGRHVVATKFPMLPMLPGKVQGEGCANRSHALPSDQGGGDLKWDAVRPSEDLYL